jgi:hypothetical protein
MDSHDRLFRELDSLHSLTLSGFCFASLAGNRGGSDLRGPGMKEGCSGENVLERER